MECFIVKFHNHHNNSTRVKIYGIGPDAVQEGRERFIDDADTCNALDGCSSKNIYLRETLADVLETFTGYDRIEGLDPEVADEFLEVVEAIEAHGHDFEVESSDYVSPGVAPVIKCPNGLTYYPAGSIFELGCAVEYFRDDGRTVEIFESLEDVLESGDDDVLRALLKAPHHHPSDVLEILFKAGLINRE